MGARGRHGARRLLLQALYQSQVGGQETDELVQQFSSSKEFSEIDNAYFLALLKEILADTAALETHIVAAADRPVEQLDPIERSVLWIGLAELGSRKDVPTRVIINEAVELAKEFGAQDSYRYINAILDKVSGNIR
jgi:N utilization substance protein B